MPRLSVIIPAYNERSTLEPLLTAVQAVPVEKEIILVDDGSTDGTRELIRERYSDRPGLKTIFHDNNRGKGSAIRTGLERASGEIVLIQDADLEYDPNDYLKILNAFDGNGVSVVYGTRFQGMGLGRFLKLWFEKKVLGRPHEIKRAHLFLGIQLLNFLSNLLYNAKITDEATCYKAFRKEVLGQIRLRCRGFEFCPEVTAKVRKAGYRIREVPISYHPRSSEEGKKLNWRHGVEAALTLIKYRFTD